MASAVHHNCHRLLALLLRPLPTPSRHPRLSFSPRPAGLRSFFPAPGCRLGTHAVALAEPEFVPPEEEEADEDARFVVVTFYKFVPLEDPHAEVVRHLNFLQGRNIHGRIYLNEQGINAQYSGPHKDAVAYADWVKKHHRFSDMLVQTAPAVTGHAFPRLKLRYKPSLVQEKLHMFHAEVSIDGFSLACFLSAAATLASIESGKQLHCCAVKLGLGGQVSLSNSLINMYSRCKCLEDAKRAFQSIREPSVVSWNAIISGTAFNGSYTEALSVFEDMILAGAQPDGITFTVVLSACSHGGLVDIGIKHFNSMTNLFDVPPQKSHYTWFLDMLGRAGRFTEVAHTIEAMPVQPDVSIYRTLLAYCKLHNEQVVGEYIAKKVLELDPSDSLLRNMLSGISSDTRSR